MPPGWCVAVVPAPGLRYRPVTVSPFARINSSRSPLLYAAIAAVLLTLIIGAGAAIATHNSPDRAHSAPVATSSQLPSPQPAAA